MTLKRPRPQPRWTVGGLPVTVRRSARRHTLSLHVAPGAVTVHAPARTPESLIESFLEAKRAWAERHLAAYAARPGPAPLADGSPLPFLGETLTLRLTTQTRAPFRSGDEVHIPPGDPDALRRAAERWYRQAALPELRALVEGYAQALGARDRLRSVRLSAARTRWGSCTAAGDIRLHWLLARAPREVAAYVALHEAAHLLELNHSPRYWAHVARLMPGHTRWRAWLKEHAHTLALG
ncbi:M48 family metallopeptidase [Deinococcus planocerae]|uniref:M48 family metallopeptidase n=1 Tax=Deinococcus planocerae TaxID=1737569 RepID=UPI001FEC309C|nr:SprT family zinc-dependent metalloprotease [Deinococcus planocerae]